MSPAILCICVIVFVSVGEGNEGKYKKIKFMVAEKATSGMLNEIPIWELYICTVWASHVENTASWKLIDVEW